MKIDLNYENIEYFVKLTPRKWVKRIKSLEQELLSYNPEIKDEMITKRRELFDCARKEQASAPSYFLVHYNYYLMDELKKYAD